MIPQYHEIQYCNNIVKVNCSVKIFVTASQKFRYYVVNLCEVWSQEFLGGPSQHVDLKILRNQGTYHLEIKVPTTQKFQYGRKINWLTPFHFESFRKYGLLLEAMQFFYSFQPVQPVLIYFIQCRGLFSLHVKFYSFVLMHKVSTQGFFKIY